MPDLALFQRVGKTGSSTIHTLFLLAAASTRSRGTEWLCTPNRFGPQHATPCSARAELAIGGAPVYGTGDVAHNASPWRRGLRLFTTLREPVERTVSEWLYFCKMCGDRLARPSSVGDGKFCGRISNTSCAARGGMSLSEWAERAPNHYTRQFSRHWPEQSFLHAYTHGFPEAAPVSMRDVDVATRVLTHPSSLVLYTDEMDNVTNPAAQRVALERLRAWLGGPNHSRAARALAPVEAFPRENAASVRYVPTPAERALLCRANWADCLLWERLRPGRACACLEAHG